MKWKLFFVEYVYFSKALIPKNTILCNSNFGGQDRIPCVRFGRHVKALICIVFGHDMVHTMEKLLFLLFKIPGPLGSSSAFMPKLPQCSEVLLQFQTKHVPYYWGRHQHLCAGICITKFGSLKTVEDQRSYLAELPKSCSISKALTYLYSLATNHYFFSYVAFSLTLSSCVTSV